MKLIGIDYGVKRVGIAFSDEDGILAFPHSVLESNKKLLENLKNLCNEEDVRAIVIGESLNSKGEPNPVMKKVIPFKEQLESELELPVYFEKEFMTSMHAAIGEKKGEFKKEVIDASAAALILQRFLDKKNNK